MPFRISRVEADREQAGRGARLQRSLGAGRPAAQPPVPAVEGVVQVAGELAGAAADVLEQADALRGDRRSDLGRLGDALDQLLGLLALQHLGPYALGGRASQDLVGRLLGGVALEGAVERALRRAVHPEAPADPARSPPPELRHGLDHPRGQVERGIDEVLPGRRGPRAQARRPRPARRRSSSHVSGGPGGPFVVSGSAAIEARAEVTARAPGPNPRPARGCARAGGRRSSRGPTAARRGSPSGSGRAASSDRRAVGPRSPS